MTLFFFLSTTFLPEDTKADEVYKFRNGRIAKNISDELPFILLNILQENTELNCIIDDFNSTYTLDYKDRRETYPTRPC